MLQCTKRFEVSNGCTATRVKVTRLTVVEAKNFERVCLGRNRPKNDLAPNRGAEQDPSLYSGQKAYLKEFKFAHGATWALEAVDFSGYVGVPKKGFNKPFHSLSAAAMLKFHMKISLKLKVCVHACIASGQDQTILLRW
ncbi:hypothetical protein N7517_001593 [Penicillium concentricum]|uniref:Uncharacterized protein n=1 Tax=Penicillium concentricum TaxID=293559 RepID=A0A9W9VJ03_9EURO|nr:uncharacterized protein N7517_001593 [Penicillium concentricum]KAJ5383682.1 hypothetical protein N7517_001593 [Penicillium concentricum]